MYTNFQQHLQKELADIKEAGLYKNERIIASPQSGEITLQDGSKVLNFCANNYLGPANDPRLIAAAKEAMDTHGYGMASVRFICGCSDLHVAGKRGVVRDGRMVADHHVVRHMHERHQEHVVADDGLQLFKRRPVDRDELADDRVVSDFAVGDEAAVETVILRLRADEGVHVDAAVGADGGVTADFDVGVDIAVVADLHVVFDDGIRPDLDVFADLGVGRYDRGWVNHDWSFRVPEKNAPIIYPAAPRLSSAFLIFKANFFFPRPECCRGGIAYMASGMPIVRAARPSARTSRTAKQSARRIARTAGSPAFSTCFSR